MNAMTFEEMKAYRLSPNFDLSEFCCFPEALKLGVNNVPDKGRIIRLQIFCDNVLQPIRNHFGSPVIIERGFVSDELAKAMKISSDSRHIGGFAVDFRVEGVGNQEVVDWVAQNLNYDILLLEGPAANPMVHVSFFMGFNRYLNLTSEDRQNLYKLSNNFTLWELVNSERAKKLGIANNPDEETVFKLQALAQNVLQPVREHFGRPVHVSSGYRSPALNAVIKGASLTSQHKKGEAADFEIFGVSNYELADWIRENLEFDQLILEHHNPAKGPNDGWVHASYTTARPNRRQCLHIGSDGTFSGLSKDA